MMVVPCALAFVTVGVTVGCFWPLSDRLAQDIAAGCLFIGAVMFLLAVLGL